jgi:hypothetical protein
MALSPLYCTNCGVANHAGAQLCSNCGQPLQIATPSQVPQATPSSANVWSIGRRQVVAMIAGTALFGFLDYALGLLYSSASNNSPLFNPLFPWFIGGFSYSPTLGTIIFGLPFTIIYFFGAKFGPWVGVVSAVVGSLLGDYIAFHVLSPWYFYIQLAILGFFPGLALSRTLRHSKSRGAISHAVAMSAVGIVISGIFGASGDSIANHVPWFFDFFTLTSGYIIGLILLPILLLVYNATVRGRKSTLTTP